MFEFKLICFIIVNVLIYEVNLFYHGNVLASYLNKGVMCVYVYCAYVCVCVLKEVYILIYVIECLFGFKFVSRIIICIYELLLS